MAHKHNFMPQKTSHKACGYYNYAIDHCLCMKLVFCISHKFLKGQHSVSRMIVEEVDRTGSDISTWSTLTSVPITVGDINLTLCNRPLTKQEWASL